MSENVPDHAEQPLAKRPEHKFALYHVESNTTFLPFVITGQKNGDIVSAVARVKLQKSQGHIAALGLGDYDSKFKQKMPVWICTADGFRHANTIAGWTVTFPQQVHVPGLGLAPNPYIETDKSGAFVKGFARAIGIGRSALTGDLMVVDRPTHISIQSYIEEDLAGKAMYNPTAIVWGTREMNPMDGVRSSVETRNQSLQEQIDNPQTKDWLKKKLQQDMIHESAIDRAEAQRAAKMWRFFPISRIEQHTNHPEDVGLWVNMGSQVVTRVFTTLINKRKFGARLLPAIAERNVLRTALGFYRAPEGAVSESWPNPDRPDGTYGKAPKVLEAIWKPLITVHRMNFSPQELDDMRARYLAGIQGGLLTDAVIDVEVEENSMENMLIVEPTGDALDGGEGKAIVVQGEMVEDEKIEMDERQTLILEIGKYTKMLELEVVDQMRAVIFDDPVFINMNSEPLEKLRHFVTLLKKEITNQATREVTDEEGLFGKAGKE